MLCLDRLCHAKLCPALHLLILQLTALAIEPGANLMALPAAVLVLVPAGRPGPQADGHQPGAKLMTVPAAVLILELQSR